MKSTIVFFASLAAFALAAGCRGPQTPPPGVATDANARGDAASRSPNGADAAVDRAVQENQGGSLGFSDEVLRACPGIRAPKFGYDSAALGKDWSDALSALATCTGCRRFILRSKSGYFF